MYSVGMDGWTLERLEEDASGRASAVFGGLVDEVRLRVELDLEPDLLARGGSLAPFVTAGIRVSQAGVGRRLGWRGISSALLRKIPVGALADAAGRTLADRLRERGKVPQREREYLRKMAELGPKDDNLLRLVGELYAEALLEGASPTKGVADQLGVSAATATRWVRRSRDLGYIPALRSELGRERGDK